MTTAGLFITTLMFIGASPGSTGGLKTTTIRVLTSCTKAILQGKEEVLFYERKVAVSRLFCRVLVGSATVMVSTILIALTDGN